MEKSLKLKIPSLLDNVRIVESFIDHAKELYGFNDDVYGNIMIAVTESVSNAIIHGKKKDKQKNVHVSLDVNEHEIAFTVQDEGKGFDYNNLPDPTSPENIEKLGGRGIFLIKNLADDVKFKANGTTIEMRFFI